MYLVFGYFHYGAGGGFSDLVYMNKNLNKVFEFLSNDLDVELDEFQIINIEKDIIIEGSLTEVLDDLKDCYWDSFKDYLSSTTFYRD